MGMSGYDGPMRLLRMTLPVVGLVVMMVADGNQTLLYVSYGIFAVAAALFIAGFVSDARGQGGYPPDR